MVSASFQQVQMHHYDHWMIWMHLADVQSKKSMLSLQLKHL